MFKRASFFATLSLLSAGLGGFAVNLFADGRVSLAVAFSCVLAVAACLLAPVGVSVYQAQKGWGEETTRELTIWAWILASLIILIWGCSLLLWPGAWLTFPHVLVSGVMLVLSVRAWRRGE